jgi:hypothetical protein
MGLGGVNGALTEQEKVLARAAIILEKTTAAQGDAARTSGSYANQLKRLQGVWQDLSIALGTVILPTALQVVQALSSLIATIQQLPVSTQTTIVVLAGLAATLGPILAAIGLMAQGVGGLATAFAFIMGLAAKFTGALVALAGGWSTVVVAMRAVLALAAGMLSWPVVLGVAFGVLVVAVVKHWDEIVSAVTGAFDSLGETAQSTIDSIRDWFGSAFDWIGDKIRSVLEWAMEKLRAIQSLMQSVIGGGSGGGAGAPGFAGGGRVRGRGRGPATASSPA